MTPLLLDIDFVLNNHKSNYTTEYHRHYDICDDNLQNLKKLIDSNLFKIIIISDRCQIEDRQYFDLMFEKLGINIPVILRTDYSDKPKAEACKQIALIEKFPFTPIIDDDDLNLGNRFLHYKTDPSFGLTDKIMSSLIYNFTPRKMRPIEQPWNQEH